MALGFVQGTFANSTGAGTVLAKAFSVSVTAGDLLVALVQTPTTAGGMTLTDNMTGNSWSAVTQVTIGGEVIYRSEVIATSTGSVTITATANTSVGFINLYIGEWNIGGHALARDVNDVTGSDAGTSFASASITTTNNPDILICWYSNNGSLTGLSSGWTQNVYDTPNGNGYASAVVTTAAAYQLTATQPGGGDVSVIYAYKATTSGTININATVPLTPDTVLTLTPQLALKTPVGILPGTVLSFGAQLQQPDTIAITSATIQTLTPGVLEQMIAPFPIQNILALTANVTGPTLLSGANAPTPATVVTPRPRNIHGPQIYI